MCEYCRKHLPDELIDVLGERISYSSSSDYIGAWIDKNNLWVESSSMVTKLKINFCPMCGRKL